MGGAIPYHTRGDTVSSSGERGDTESYDTMGNSCDNGYRSCCGSDAPSTVRGPVETTAMREEAERLQRQVQQELATEATTPPSSPPYNILHYTTLHDTILYYTILYNTIRC